MQRREFLKLAFFSGVALVSASLGWRVYNHWYNQKPQKPYVYLSSEEVTILEAIAESVFPVPLFPSPKDFQLAIKVDQYLSLLPDPDIVTGLKLLLHVFADFTQALHPLYPSYSEIPVDLRLNALKTWENSKFGERRMALQAVKALLSVLYFEEPVVRHRCGIQYSCLHP